MGCYISNITYHDKSFSFLENFDNSIEITVRDIETGDIVTNYDKPYGLTNEGLYATDLLYWKLYATIDFSHIVHANSDNLGETLIQCYIDDYKTLFRVSYSWSIIGKDCRTLGGILVNTDWYYIEGDYIYIKQLPMWGSEDAENLVYKILDRKQFDIILAKLRTLKR